MSINTARLLFECGRIKDSEDLCRQILQNQPNEAPAMYLLGCIALKAGQYSQAVEIIKKAITISPDRAGYYNILGQSLNKLGRFGEAEKVLRTAIKNEPNNYTNYLQLGNALDRQGKRNDATAIRFHYLSMLWKSTTENHSNIAEHNHPLNSSNFDQPDYQGKRKMYVLCSSARSGSTFLCNLLAQRGDLGVPHEYLNFIAHGQALIKRLAIGSNDLNFSRNYFDTIKRVRTSPNGVFGLNAHYYQFEIMLNTNLLNEVFPDLKFIHIIRRDKIAQAVSHTIANQTGQWDSTMEARTEPVYDASLINDLLSVHVMQDAYWNIFFQIESIEPLVLYYEDIVTDSSKSCRQIAEFLEVETENIFTPENTFFKKQRNQRNAEWAERFRAERKIR